MNKRMDLKTTGLKILGAIGMILAALISIFSVLLCNSIVWMFKTWRNLTMDELMYQLNAPMEGTDEGIIQSFMDSCIPGTVLVLLLILILFAALRRKKKVFCISLGMITLASLLSMGYFLHMTWERLDIGNYSQNQSIYSTFIDNNYEEPREVDLVFPEQKRNLIYIFLESMEITYSDQESGGAFEDNYIPELTEIAWEGEDFSGEETTLNGGYAMPCTTWTVAGMFAQSSGLPLMIPISSNYMDTQDTFFPEVTAIGDILQQQGYSQTLLIGSDATFGGRRLLFGQHGDYDIRDYNYAIETGLLPDDYRVWWGYEDDKLFDYAKETLQELADQEQPFNLTMLTADTHFEDGYICEDCDDTYGDNQYANVIACSSEKVAEFVRWIQKQDFYQDTTIVISGDHWTMDSDFCAYIDEAYERKVYTVYLNSAVTAENPDKRRGYTTFDNFPTTLASLGVEIAGNRLGLGTNLFSEELTLVETYGKERMESELSKKSELMERLGSDIDENNQAMLDRISGEPVQTVKILEYNEEENLFSVQITDTENVEDGVAAMSVAVWTEADQSDLLWMQAELQDDGSYMIMVNPADFKDKREGYHIHAYVVDNMGEQYFYGGINSGSVE